MRFWTDHQIDTDTFQESIRGLVRNAPWWGISAVVHVLILLVLATVTWSEPPPTSGPQMVSTLPPPEDPIDPDDEIVPPEDIEREPVVDPDIEVEYPESDTDTPTDAPEGMVGDTTGPFDTSFDTTPIGLEGSPGGGRRTGGNKRARCEC